MKIKTVIKILIWIFVIVCVYNLTRTSLEIVGYLNGVEADVYRKLKLSKEFLIKYRFSGKVINREFCREENDMVYYISIKLDSLVKSPPLPYNSYYSRYNFDLTNKILKINVSKEIYEKSDRNVIVVKPAMSDSIFIDDKFYLLLGTDEHEWLPY